MAGASLSSISSFPSLFRKPNMLSNPNTVPRLMASCCPKRTASDFFADSSCASAEKIDRRSSPSLSRLRMPSVSNQMPTPTSRSFLEYIRLSSVFLAKRETAFVTIRSNLPFSASSIILLNCTLALTDVPEMPLSTYSPTNVHAGIPWIFLR